MKDLIKRGQALRVSEMDSSIYLALNCLPSVEAIPVEYIESTMNRWKEIIGYEESVDALRILIDNWKNEREEE